MPAHLSLPDNLRNHFRVRRNKAPHRRDPSHDANSNRGFHATYPIPPPPLLQQKDKATRTAETHSADPDMLTAIEVSGTKDTIQAKASEQRPPTRNGIQHVNILSPIPQVETSCIAKQPHCTSACPRLSQAPDTSSGTESHAAHNENYRASRFTEHLDSSVSPQAFDFFEYKSASFPRPRARLRN